ncbi:MAG: DUF1579 domain-containing protein [Candidatus Aminicenantes bacterium]|nr:DUF1579 domain-containing protein [Candidatus Aminicenantes bacterium]
MSKRYFCAFGLLFVLVISLCFPESTQEAKKEQQEMMEAYMKFMVVTENHAFFKNFVGEWDVQTTAWMQPGAEPVTAKNTSKADLILGGRFLKTKFKGNMFGQPFEGLQIVGYDNAQKKYISFWIDNSSTGFFLMSGTRDESGKVLTDTGEWPDPLTGEIIKTRAVTKVISKDEFIYELYMTGPDGIEFRSMENQYKRKK